MTDRSLVALMAAQILAGGHPDAAEGCRIILKRIDAALGDK